MVGVYNSAVGWGADAAADSRYKFFLLCHGLAGRSPALWLQLCISYSELDRCIYKQPIYDVIQGPLEDLKISNAQSRLGSRCGGEATTYLSGFDLLRYNNYWVARYSSPDRSERTKGVTELGGGFHVFVPPKGPYVLKGEIPNLLSAESFTGNGIRSSTIKVVHTR